MAEEVRHQQSKSMSGVQKYMGHIFCKHNSYTRRCVTDIIVSTSSQYMTVLVESGTGEEARRQFQTGNWLIQDTNHGLPKIVVRMDEIRHTS